MLPEQLFEGAARAPMRFGRAEEHLAAEADHDDAEHFEGDLAWIGSRGELARVDGIVPLLKQTADFNWHGAAARSLLRNPSFRRVVFSSIWS